MFRAATSNAAKTRVLVNVVAGAAVVALVVCHALDPLMGFIATLVLQVGVMLHSVFLLVVFLEYHDKLGYDAPSIERLANPMFRAGEVVRAFHAAELLLLGSYVTAVCVAAVGVYSQFFRRVKTVDSTRLWKDIQDILFDAKALTAADMALLFINMFFMMNTLLGTLSS